MRRFVWALDAAPLLSAANEAMRCWLCLGRKRARGGDSFVSAPDIWLQLCFCRCLPAGLACNQLWYHCARVPMRLRRGVNSAIRDTLWSDSVLFAASNSAFAAITLTRSLMVAPAAAVAIDTKIATMTRFCCMRLQHCSVDFSS